MIAWQKLNVTGTRVPYLFRSYRHPRSAVDDILERNPDRDDHYQIWQVGRATAAAPFYFKAVRLEEEDEKSEYIDGGFGANNPSEEAYRSVKQLSNNRPDTVKVLVSIGTGKNLEADPNPNAGYRMYLSYANTAAKWATQSETTHHTVFDATRNNGADYHRLNVEHGIGKMKLDAWKGKRGCKTLELLRSRTADYLNSSGGKREVTNTARLLVEVRRARSNPQSDLNRWERFSQGVEYACCVNTCSEGDMRWKYRKDLRHHLELLHRCDPAILESLLDNGKRFPPDTKP